MLLAVKNYVLVKDLSVATIASLPETVAKDHYFRSPGFVFLRYKVATQRRRGTEQGKEVLRHRTCHDLFRLAVTGDVKTAKPRGRHFFENTVLGFPVDIVSDRNVVLGHVPRRISFPDDGQTVRLSKTQRLQEHRINQTEDCRVSTDSQRQRKHGYHGESRLAQESSQAIANVLK